MSYRQVLSGILFIGCGAPCTFVWHPAAGLTIHQDIPFQACFPVFSTVCLELAATNSSDQWVSDCLFKPRLKTFFFTQAFTEHWSDPSTSAFEVTTVQRYINSIIIIIINQNDSKWMRLHWRTCYFICFSSSSAECYKKWIYMVWFSIGTI